MKTLSLCVPAYFEEENILEFYHQVTTVINEKLPNYDYEIIFVNDGSTDNTLNVMTELAINDLKVKVVDLSRNYGKEIAMYAGLENSTGDMVVIMDSDLQHPPQLIPDMVKLWELGYQDVYGKRTARQKEPWLKIKFSQWYYQVLAFLSKSNIEDGVGDFRLLDRECVEALLAIKDKQRYTKGMYDWIGFKKVAINFEAQERFAGETKWHFKDLIRLAMDGITSTSTYLLKISTYFGFLLSLGSFGYLLYTIIRAVMGKTAVPGYSSLMTVILILGGIQLISIGILGEYVGKISNESKERPIYLLNKKTSKNIKE